MLKVIDYEGTLGDRTHMTRKASGRIPVERIAHLSGARGEVRGEHRNRKDEKWAEFLDDIETNGIENPIFITVDHGQEPVISEGNHRLDAAVELGQKDVPVEIRWFGHAEYKDDGLLEGQA